MWVVAGASGFVGAATLECLRANGIGAVGLYRRAVDGKPGRVVHAYERDTLRVALRGATGVIHCAAVVHQPHGPSSAHAFNVEGTRVLINAARDVGARSFLFVSSIKVHGERPPKHINEQTEVAADGPYASSKVEAEELVRDATDLRTAIVRLCPVYGPGDKGNVRTMIRAIQRRLFFVPGDGSTRKSIVHVSSVAGSLAALASSRAGGTFVVADDEAPSLRTLADTIARALGRPPPVSMPLPVLRVAAHVLALAASVVRHRTTFAPAQIDKATTSTICDPSRLERELGIRCHVDLERSIREEVEWLRNTGAL